MARAVDSVTVPVRIAIVGKYTGLQDSYLSVIKVCATEEKRIVLCKEREGKGWIVEFSSIAHD